LASAQAKDAFVGKLLSTQFADKAEILKRLNPTCAMVQPRLSRIGIAVTVLEPRARILCAVTVIPSALSWRRNIPVKAA
jgi:hypothetical protein